MTTRIIRTRFFLAVEGEGEQSFIRWLQQVSEQHGLYIHLEYQPLNGGGYKTMLKNTLHYRQRNQRRNAKSSILLVDGECLGNTRQKINASLNVFLQIANQCCQ